MAMGWFCPTERRMDSGGWRIPQEPPPAENVRDPRLACRYSHSIVAGGLVEMS